MASQRGTSEKINHWPGVLIFLIAVGIVAFAFINLPSHSLCASLLVNIGTTLGLVWPIHGITQSMRIRVVHRVDQQQKELSDWKKTQDQELSQISQRLMSLEEREDLALSSQKEKRDEQRSDFSSLKDGEPLGRVLVRALKTALKRNLIDDKYEVEVPFSASSDYTVGLKLDSYRVKAQLFDHVGEPVLETPMIIFEHSNLDTFVSDLGEQALNKGVHAQASPTSIFGGLADALLAVEKQSGIGPIIQHFPSKYPDGTRDWVLTRNNIAALGAEAYIDHDAIDRKGQIDHYQGKSWIDNESFEAAQMAAEKFKKKHLRGA